MKKQKEIDVETAREGARESFREEGRVKGTYTRSR